jgi:hypothetical protein
LRADGAFSFAELDLDPAEHLGLDGALDDGADGPTAARAYLKSALGVRPATGA